MKIVRCVYFGDIRCNCRLFGRGCFFSGRFG